MASWPPLYDVSAVRAHFLQHVASFGSDGVTPTARTRVLSFHTLALCRPSRPDIDALLALAANALHTLNLDALLMSTGEHGFRTAVLQHRTAGKSNRLHLACLYPLFYKTHGCTCVMDVRGAGGGLGTLSPHLGKEVLALGLFDATGLCGPCLQCRGLFDPALCVPYSQCGTLLPAFTDATLPARKRHLGKAVVALLPPLPEQAEPLPLHYVIRHGPAETPDACRFLADPAVVRAAAFFPPRVPPGAFTDAFRFACGLGGVPYASDRIVCFLEQDGDRPLRLVGASETHRVFLLACGIDLVISPAGDDPAAVVHMQHGSNVDVTGLHRCTMHLHVPPTTVMLFDLCNTVFVVNWLPDADGFLWLHTSTHARVPRTARSVRPLFLPVAVVPAAPSPSALNSDQRAMIVVAPHVDPNRRGIGALRERVRKHGFRLVFARTSDGTHVRFWDGDMPLQHHVAPDAKPWNRFTVRYRDMGIRVRARTAGCNSFTAEVDTAVPAALTDAYKPAALVLADSSERQHKAASAAYGPLSLRGFSVEAMAAAQEVRRLTFSLGASNDIGIYLEITEREHS